jgi:signal transduction histidine kinase
VEALSPTEGRLRALFAAGLAVSSELSLDGLLRRLVEAAAEPRATSQDGIGLLGMRERLALLDGRLELESRPGAGRTVVAEVPLA